MLLLLHPVVLNDPVQTDETQLAAAGILFGILLGYVDVDE